MAELEVDPTIWVETSRWRKQFSGVDSRLGGDGTLERLILAQFQDALGERAGSRDRHHNSVLLVHENFRNGGSRDRDNRQASGHADRQSKCRCRSGCSMEHRVSGGGQFRKLERVSEFRLRQRAKVGLMKTDA